MKRFFTTLTCCILYTFLVSCSSGDDNPKQPEEENPLQGITAIVPPSGTFAEDDGATKSTGTPAQDVAKFLTEAGAKAIQGLGSIEIKDNEYKEIKDFTSELVKDAKSDKNKVYKLDLLSADAMASPAYYLEQGDVVYVQPNRYKAATSEINQNRTFWISIASTLLTAASLVISIVTLSKYRH